MSREWTVTELRELLDEEDLTPSEVTKQQFKILSIADKLVVDSTN